MIRGRFSALLSLTLLGGCSSAPTVPMVSEQDAQSLIAQIQVPGMQPKVDQVVTWMQPDNKKEACKIFTSSHAGSKVLAEPGTKISWDGECKDGYAYGLGREFVDNRYGLTSTLGTYVGGQKEPFYEATTFFDKGMVVIGDLTGKKFLTIQVQQSPLPFHMNSSFINTDDRFSYQKVEDLGGQGTSLVKVFGSGYVYRFFKFSDPTIPMDFVMEVMKDGRPVGYRIEKLKNGTLQGVSMQGPQPQVVGLPASLVNFYNAQYQEIVQKLPDSKAAYDQALVTIERYKRTICGKTAKVDYVDQEKYLMICSEDGDLLPYKEKIAQVLRDQKEKQAQQAAAAASDRQDRLAQANAEARNNSLTELTNTANDFSRSMNNYSQNMMDTIRQNNQSGQSFQAQPKTYDTNCVQVANIINCKTR